MTQSALNMGAYCLNMQKLTNDNLMTVADHLMVGSFNAFTKCVRKYPSKPFSFPETREVGDCRRIVQSWVPQTYEPGKLQKDFDVPYVLGSYFDRYISSHEGFNKKRLEAKAAVKFIETNNDGDAIDEYVLKHPLLSGLIDRMANIVGALFQDKLDVTKLYHLTGHGPNGTTTVARRDAFLHIKDRDLSGTQASLQQFHHYLRWDTQLRDVLVEYSDELRASINGVNQPIGTVVDCTETSFVPKSWDSLRTMCPETNTVAYFAQMLAAHITVVLKSIGIDLTTQPEVHKSLAKLGSMFPELNIGTVDWSTASDRIWLILVKHVFSKADSTWYHFMENVCRHQRTRVKFTAYISAEDQFKSVHELEDFLATSCEEYTLDLRKRGKGSKGGVPVYVVECVIKTNMFATMGNPLTFPLQTLIFYAFLLACTEEAENRLFQESGNPTALQFPSSFGDDGIIDTRAMPEVRYYADLLNWKLNQDKSFVEGAFRESCGGDYYAGRYCRPFSPKRPPLQDYNSPKQNLRILQAWIYMVANNVSSLVCAMGFDPAPMENWVLQTHQDLKLGKVCVVPPSFPDGSGLRVEGFLKRTRVDYDSDIPQRLLGLGLDNPDPLACPELSVGFHGMDQYHWPYFSWFDRSYSFKCLVSSPSQRPIEDELVESHYYYVGLKRSLRKRMRSAPLSTVHDVIMI